MARSMVTCRQTGDIVLEKLLAVLHFDPQTGARIHGSRDQKKLGTWRRTHTHEDKGHLL